MTLSLRAKVLGIVTSAFVAAFAIYVAAVGQIMLAQNRDFVSAELTTAGHFLRTELERLLALGIPLDEISGFDESCKRAEWIVQDIAYIAVVNTGGKVVLCADQAVSAPIADHPWVAHDLPRSGVVHQQTMNGVTYVETLIPVSDLSDRVVGYVRSGMSVGAADKAIIQAIGWASAAGLSILALGLAISFALLRKYVAKPLNGLLEGIREIAATPERMDERLASHSDDEVGEISTAFNEALARLEEATVSRGYFDSIVASIGNALVVADEDGIIRFANRTAAEESGFNGDTLSGAPIAALLACPLWPDDGDKMEASRRAVEVVIDDRLQNVEGALFTREGHRYPVLLSGTVIPGSHPGKQQIIVVATDITDRKQAEQAMLREKRRAETYLEIAGTMILALDSSGRVVRLNRKGSEVLGWTEDELRGRDWFEVAVPEDLRGNIRNVFGTLMSATDGAAGEYVEHRVLTKSGRVRLIAWHNTIATNDTGAVIGTLSSGEDITERREMERNALQGQRMESLGSLAGGIAHDFNNMLLPILTLTGMTVRNLPEGGRDRERLERVREAATRAKELVEKILAFGRRVEPNRTNLDVVEVVRRAMELVAVTLPATIELQQDIDPATGRISGDAGQLETVLLNLISNAVDAFEGKTGTIRVALGANVVNHAFADSMPDLEPGPYAKLSVTDNGTGMPPEVLDRVLDPFFTTKEVGQGTGLGLPSAYGIVTKHGGALHISSEPGKGTTVEIFLPLVSDLADAD